MAIESRNPATGEVEAAFDEWDSARVGGAIQQAADAFAAWRWEPVETRAKAVGRLAASLRDHAEQLAALMTAEMGKPIAQSREEVEKCAACCDYFAEHGPEMLATQPVEAAAAPTTLSFEPLGPILAVMPWNFPAWQLIRFAGPTFVAGNTVVLKHASNVPRSALLLEELVRAAGFPEGALKTVLVGGKAASELISDDRIRAVTFTGSDEAGAKVAGAAGRARKKSVLELGGSDPFIVLAGADIEGAAQAAVAARFARNCGQACNAPKRFIVEAPVLERFTAALVEAVRAVRLGDPTDEATEAGPMAREDLRETLIEQVRRSETAGARLLIGGHAIEGPGAYFAPAILDRVLPGMAVFDEETFGPVGAITGAKDADEAVALANHTRFGLAAAIWTADLDRGRDLAARIEAGSIAVNGTVSSEPAVPFGGVRDSGYGRELSPFGLREFVNIKAVKMA